MCNGIFCHLPSVPRLLWTPSREMCLVDGAESWHVAIGLLSACGWVVDDRKPCRELSPARFSSLNCQVRWRYVVASAEEGQSEFNALRDAQPMQVLEQLRYVVHVVFRLLYINLAATLRTDWSRSSMYVRIPASGAAVVQSRQYQWLAVTTQLSDSRTGLHAVARRGRMERAARPGRQSGGGGKMGVKRGSSGISRLLVAAKLQSAPGADNPRYSAAGLACWLNVGRFGFVIVLQSSWRLSSRRVSSWTHLRPWLERICPDLRRSVQASLRQIRRGKSLHCELILIGDEQRRTIVPQVAQYKIICYGRDNCQAIRLKPLWRPSWHWYA